jgi:hypothetical protein
MVRDIPDGKNRSLFRHLGGSDSFRLGLNDFFWFGQTKRKEVSRMSTQALAVKPGIWSAIGNFFKHAEVVVGEVFITLFGADAAHNFAASAESLLKTELGQIALTAVTEVSSMAVGIDKRATAQSKIMAAAKSAGIGASQSIVNLLLELCVQRVQGAFGGAPIAAASVPAPTAAIGDVGQHGQVGDLGTNTPVSAK